MIDETTGYRPGSGRRFSLAFGGFWLVLFLSTFLVGGPWAGFHGCLFLATALLMFLCPPDVALPRLWWILGTIFLLLGTAAFLPAGWFAMPEWRPHLEEIGLDTGSMVVIQARMAAESLAVFGFTILGGFWIASQRATSSQLRTWALAFAVGVAVYAVISKIHQNSGWGAGLTTGKIYGFFPNRNHTGTYLAMGSVCGLGCVMQAIRDKSFARMALALAAVFTCLLAVIGWSISRGGLLMTAIGALAWICILGPQYLGSNGRKAIGLMALAVVGGFMIADSTVKQRFSGTLGKTGDAISSARSGSALGGKTAMDDAKDIDFRIPTALDTIDLIRDFKWTGIGAGQFYYIFPQYRNLTAVVNDSDNYHPESDWLWMASEMGVPATVALLALVLLAFRKGILSVLIGRDRALRGACLVAAALVPLHGIFDVPGHRISLAWSAAFLFALALKKSEKSSPPPSLALPSWSFRMIALVLLFGGMFLARAEWWGGPEPALIASKKAQVEADQLHRQYLELTAKPPAVPKDSGLKEAPQNLIDKALVRLETTRDSSPLDRGALRLYGYLSLYFEGQEETIRKSFLIERSLDPTWVRAPLEQALAWSNADLQETAQLWQEAIGRARWLDQHHPGTFWSEANVLKQIKQQARSNPKLEPLLDKSIPKN